MNIICFGQMNWDWCWTGKQHLMTQLAYRGHRILYVDPKWDWNPKGFFGSIKAAFPVWSKLGLREIDHSLFIYTHPYSPFLRYQPSELRYPWILKRLINNLGFNDSIVISLLPQSQPIIESLKPNKLVYYAIDEMTAFGGTLPEDKIRIRQQEEKLIKQSTMVLSVSYPLLNRIKVLHPNAHLLPNAVDPHHYSPLRLERLAAHTVLPFKNGPFITFMGQLDERLDQTLIAKIAHKYPSWTIILAGRIKQGVDFSTLKEIKNILFTGYLPYEELPSILKNTDVCIVPYHLNELTQSCSPIKVYEYLASGKPVVSTPLPGLMDCAEVIKISSTHDNFISCIESSLNKDTIENISRRLEKASEHSWEKRTDKLENLLKEIDKNKISTEENTLKIPKRQKNLYYNHPVIHDESLQPSTKLKLFLSFIAIIGKLFYALRISGRLLTGKRPLRVRKILVARKGLLGDMVLFLPTLKALRRLFKESTITLSIETPSHVNQLFKNSPYVDKVISLNFFSKSLRHKIVEGIKLFMSGYDMTITGATYFLKNEAFFAGAPLRIGINDGHPMQLFNNRLVMLDPTIHESDNNLKLVKYLGGSLNNTIKAPLIDIESKKMTPQAKDILRRVGISKTSELVIIHTGAQKKTRQWPQEKFTELSIRLLKKRQNLFILFTGTRPEHSSIEMIREQIPSNFKKRTGNIAGKTDLFSLISLLKRCSLFISSDTGVMHLARACGSPLIALLGPENDRRWGPYPLGPGPAVAIRYSVPCAPCVKKECDEHYCMKSISIDDVYHHALNFLDRKFNKKPDQGLYTLDRIAVRDAWKDLKGRGFTLPSVSVIIHRLADDPSQLISTYEELTRLLNVIQNQFYPEINVIICNPPRYARKPAISLPLTFLDAIYPDNISLWQAILKKTSSDFITSLIPGETWSASKISQDIAALIRNPQANLAASQPLTNNKPFYKSPEKFIAGITTVRRSFLENQLKKTTTQNSFINNYYQLWKSEKVYLGHNLYVK